MKKGIKINDIIPLLAFVFLFVLMTILAGNKFLSSYNLMSLLDQAIPTIIGGLGVIFVIAMGSSDLSVGATAAIASTFGAMLAEKMGFWTLFPATLLIGVLIGVLNGYIVTKFKVSSFMTTLAMLICLRGVLNYVSSKTLVYAPDALVSMNNYYVKISLLIILIIIVGYIFEYTKIGYFCKSIGENERTVNAIGIHVKKTRMTAFIISGILASIFGIVQFTKLGGSSTTLCNFMEMRIMMAIFLGGVLVTGGFSAKIYKMIIGAFTIVIIENGLILCQINGTLSATIQGVLLMGVLFATIFFNNRSKIKGYFRYTPE